MISRYKPALKAFAGGSGHILHALAQHALHTSAQLKQKSKSILLFDAQRTTITLTTNSFSHFMDQQQKTRQYKNG